MGNLALPDQHGRLFHLREEAERAPLLLVFFPWAFSPVCGDELATLQRLSAEFTAGGVMVAAVSVDSKYALRAYADSLGLAYPLLSDAWPFGEAARTFQVFDEDRGVAGRGTFLLERHGVRRSLVKEISQERTSAEFLQVAGLG